MKKVCSWCGLVMVDGPDPTSHGCCEKCEADFFEGLKDRAVDDERLWSAVPVPKDTSR